MAHVIAPSYPTLPIGGLRQIMTLLHPVLSKQLTYVIKKEDAWKKLRARRFCQIFANRVNWLFSAWKLWWRTTSPRSVVPDHAIQGRGTWATVSWSGEYMIPTFLGNIVRSDWLWCRLSENCVTLESLSNPQRTIRQYDPCSTKQWSNLIHFQICMQSRNLSFFWCTHIPENNQAISA